MRWPTSEGVGNLKTSSINIKPMEARSVDSIPVGEEWQYESKWDGFRCLLTRDADTISMHSKSGQDISRYFPEVVAAALELREKHFHPGWRARRSGRRPIFIRRSLATHPSSCEPCEEVSRANSGFVSCVRPFEEGQDRA